MGLKSGFQKFSRAMFSFRVDLWLDYKNLKTNTQYYTNQFRSLYHITPLSRTETFEEAQDRLNLSPEFLELQQKNYLFLIYFYLILAVSVFCYCLWLIQSGNIMGSLMSLAITLYALSFAFRYHFWRYQIQKRSLNCSLIQWLYDLLGIKFSASQKGNKR